MEFDYLNEKLQYEKKLHRYYKLKASGKEREKPYPSVELIDYCKNNGILFRKKSKNLPFYRTIKETTISFIL